MSFKEMGVKVDPQLLATKMEAMTPKAINSLQNLTNTLDNSDSVQQAMDFLMKSDAPISELHINTVGTILDRATSSMPSAKAIGEVFGNMINDGLDPDEFFKVFNSEQSLQNFMSNYELSFSPSERMTSDILFDRVKTLEDLGVDIHSEFTVDNDQLIQGGKSFGDVDTIFSGEAVETGASTGNAADLEGADSEAAVSADPDLVNDVFETFTEAGLRVDKELLAQKMAGMSEEAASAFEGLAHTKPATAQRAVDFLLKTNGEIKEGHVAAVEKMLTPTSNRMTKFSVRHFAKMVDEGLDPNEFFKVFSSNSSIKNFQYLDKVIAGYSASVGPDEILTRVKALQAAGFDLHTASWKLNNGILSQGGNVIGNVRSIVA